MTNRKIVDNLYDAVKELKFSGNTSWESLLNYALETKSITAKYPHTIIYNNDLEAILIACGKNGNARDFEIYQELLYSALMNMGRFITD